VDGMMGTSNYLTLDRSVGRYMQSDDRQNSSGSQCHESNQQRGRVCAKYDESLPCSLPQISLNAPLAQKSGRASFGAKFVLVATRLTRREYFDNQD
jgi:hypothetical protein